MHSIGGKFRKCGVSLGAPLAAFLLVSCGGGSGSSGLGPGPTPSYEINVSPPSQSINAGQSTTLNLSVTPANGFNQPIEVTLSGLPAGVTASPSSPFSMDTSGKSVKFTATLSAALGSSTVIFDSTSGSLQSAAQATITISQAPPGLPNDRTSFVRTDDTPLAVVFDPVHQLIFASALHLNCVEVIALTNQQIIKCIPVSGPLGLSLSTDGTKVLVGTQLGVVAWIDTTLLEVVKRDVIPQIAVPAGFVLGFNFVTAAQAFQTANGKILLFSGWGFQDLYGKFNQVSVVEWDPIAGTSVVRSDAGGGGLVSMSADHTKFLIGGQGQATLYDSAADKFIPVQGFCCTTQPAMNPAGSQFAILGGSPLVQFFDAQMHPIGSVNLSVCCGFPSAGAVYSLDGKYLYVALPNPLPTLVTIDATTFQVVGTAEAYSSEIAYFSVPTVVGHPQAADSTGLVFEIADHGVAINDANSLHDFTNLSSISGFIVATPAEGSLGQTTNTQFASAVFNSLPDVFFGNQRGLNPNFFNAAGQVAATAPPSSVPGPVNVKAAQANGPMAIMPQAFSYGAFPLQYGLLASDPKGGVFAPLFGYGYSVDVPGANIQAKIGSTVAPIQQRSIVPTLFGYPFPLQQIVVSVPSGSPGAQDITVTSPAGTGTSTKAFHFVNSVADYPSGDSFYFLLYDSHRNQVYLSAGDHIDVFSLSTHSFGAPLFVPTKNGSRLILGLALTPGGTKLLAANQTDQTVAIINPDDPTTGAVTVSLPLTGLQGNPGPFEIATTSTNHAFVTVSAGAAVSGGGSSIYDIDLLTLQVTTPILPPGSLLNLNANFIQASTDGTALIEATGNNSGGPLLSWQAASNAWHVHLVEGNFWDNIAIAGDGTVLAVDNGGFPYLLDSQLNLTAQVNVPEFQAIGDGPSMQIDQTGALLYAITGLGLDIIDTRTGQLRERVLLQEKYPNVPPEATFGALNLMAITPGGDQVFLTTTAGLTVVDLDSVPLGIGTVTPSSGPAGTVVSLRGTGFVSGTSVKVNGVSATSSLEDPATLSITIPATVQVGSMQITLTNPDGSAYSLDAAFRVQ